MSPESAGFRAMGVEIVVGGAGEDELDAVRRLFADWDVTFSRFQAGSELSRVNRSAATTLVLSARFARVLRTALAAAAATGGLVDPTLGRGIEAAGYDQDFDRLEDAGEAPGTTAPGAWRDLHLHGRVLQRPPGLALDLNGVVKSLAVDEALRLVAGDAFVAAGGDVAARGAVVVGLPAGGTVRLLGGGLATSGTTKRRWTQGGATQHHLLDPATGRPSQSRWLEVSVAGRTCLDADVAAKAAFLLSDDGPDWLDERSLPGRFVAEDGVVVENGVWRASLETEVVACS